MTERKRDLKLAVIGNGPTSSSEVNELMVIAEKQELILVVEKDLTAQALNEIGLDMLNPIEEALRGMSLFSDNFLRTKNRPPCREDVDFRPRISNMTARQHRPKPKIRARAGLK